MEAINDETRSEVKMLQMDSKYFNQNFLPVCIEAIEAIEAHG